MKALQAALAAAKAGDHQSALAQLLVAWAAHRGKTLADAVEIASARAAATRPPVVAKKTMQAGWLARAAARDPADLPALLKVIGQGRAQQIRERLTTLAKWPPDPRFHRKLIDLLVEPPLPGVSGRGVSWAVFGLLVASRDPEVARAAAAALVDQPPFEYIRHRLRKMSAATWKEFQATATKLAKFPAETPLSAKEAALLAQVVAALGTERAGAASGEALLAAVYADPTNDQPRLVYADWLSEQGDPRGEFIVLQCERARTGAPLSRREKQLEKQFGRAWAEPLGEKMAQTTLKFARGFLVECSVARLRRTPPGFDGHPAWATVEVVHFDDAGMGSVEYLSQPACKGVHSAFGVSASEVEKLTHQVTTLGITYFQVDHAELLDVVARQKKLKHLHLWPKQDWRQALPLLDAKLPRLETVDLATTRWKKRGGKWVPAEGGG